MTDKEFEWEAATANREYSGVAYDPDHGKTPLELAKDKLRAAGHSSKVVVDGQVIELFKGRSRGPDWITEEAGKL